MEESFMGVFRSYRNYNKTYTIQAVLRNYRATYQNYSSFTYQVEITEFSKNYLGVF